MEHKTKLTIIITTILLLSIATAAAWSYIKVGQTYVVTLDTGSKINVTNINYDRSARIITATIKPQNRLTIADAAEIAKITQEIQDGIDKKKNVYIKTKIVQ